jgi:DNA-binding CsgD family transcriptional regulator
VARLCESDFRRALAFVCEADRVGGPEAFPPAVLALLRELVPATAVSWHEWQVEDGRLRFHVSSHDEERTACVWEAYPCYRHEDPLPGGVEGLGRCEPVIVGRAVTISDFLSRRGFRRTGLYAEVCRPLGVENVMKIFLPVRRGVARSLVFDRGKGDFTERDRAVVDLLLPHFVQLEANAEFRRLATALAPARVGGRGIRDPALDGLTRRERQILALVAEGKSNKEIAEVLWISPATVRTHLQNVYAKLGVGTRTAALARVHRSGRRIGFDFLGISR